jgi:hypothetical protein
MMVILFLALGCMPAPAVSSAEACIQAPAIHPRSPRASRRR